MKSTSRPNLSLRFILLMAIALMAFTASAQQDPSAFFHQGARHFLATNELTQAKLSVTNGLKLFPSDEKLKKLWELLNQQQQQQSKDDQSNDKDKSEQQDKKDQKDQSSKDQQKKDEKTEQEKSKEQQEQQKKDDASKQDKKEGEDKKGQQPDKGEDQQESEGAPQSAKAMRMTPQQAMQLLEALKGEEKSMPFRPIMKTNRQDRIFKDW